MTTPPTIDPTALTPEASRDQAAAGLVHVLAALAGRQPRYAMTRPYHRTEGLHFHCVRCLAGAYSDTFLDAAGTCPECLEADRAVKNSSENPAFCD